VIRKYTDTEIKIEISIIWKFVGPPELSPSWAETNGTDKTESIPDNIRLSVCVRNCIFTPHRVS
jgi:hypothetical protein